MHGIRMGSRSERFNYWNVLEIERPKNSEMLTSSWYLAIAGFDGGRAPDRQIACESIPRILFVKSKHANECGSLVRSTHTPPPSSWSGLAKVPRRDVSQDVGGESAAGGEGERLTRAVIPATAVSSVAIAVRYPVPIWNNCPCA